MSTCISRQGEFGSHILDDEHTCTRCHVLDEDAQREELRKLRAANAELAISNDALTFQANAAKALDPDSELIMVHELRLLRDQRQQVLARHADINGFCAECVEWCCCGDTVRCSHGGVAWPCPTAAIYTAGAQPSNLEAQK